MVGVGQALVPIQKRHVRYQKFEEGTMDRNEGPAFVGEPIEGYETVKEVAVCENHVEDFLSVNEVQWDALPKTIYIPVKVIKKWSYMPRQDQFNEEE